MAGINSTILHRGLGLAETERFSMPTDEAQLAQASTATTRHGRGACLLRPFDPEAHA